MLRPRDPRLGPCARPTDETCAASEDGTQFFVIFRVATPKTQWRLQHCPELYSAAQKCHVPSIRDFPGIAQMCIYARDGVYQRALPTAAVPLTSNASTLFDTRVNQAARPLLRALSLHARRRAPRQACLANKLLALSWSPVTVGPLSPRRQFHCLPRHRRATGRQRVNGGQLQR